MSYEVVVYTHSDYSDIWAPMVDFVERNCKPLHISFAMNKVPSDLRFNEYTIYTYDDTQTYPARLVEICKKISSDYILFFHDMDILVQFDLDHFKTLMNWVLENQIDRFSLGMYPSSCFETYIHDMPVAKLGKDICDWYCTPYDVGPSIWKRSTLQELMTEFQEETYRTIEASGIQDRLLTKKVYGFAKKDLDPLFCIGRPFTKWFSFCHLFVRGLWVPVQAWQSYASFFPFLFEIYRIDPGLRGFTDFYIGMTNGLKIN